LQRQGGLAWVVLVLAAGAASPAAAQEKPETPPAPPHDAKEDKGRAAVSLLSTHDLELRKTGDEWTILLRGDVHLAIETAPEKPRPGAVDKHERQRLDLRADDAVVYVPARKDGLAPDPNRLATAVRAFYGEGHVALIQETVKDVPSKDGKETETKRVGQAFRLESSRLWIDLVSERVVAFDAVATIPGGTKRQSTLGTAAPSQTSQQAEFTLRAEKLRLAGADAIEADKASLSVCDFGLPHEAIEAEKIRILVDAEQMRRKRPKALTACAALGDVGATWVAWRSERDLPFRAFREITRGKVKDREGSDAIHHAEQDPRSIVLEGAELRVRPPYFGEEGFGLPFPIPIPYDTDWLIPQVRIGHSSRFGYFALGELKVPILKQDVVHERTTNSKEDGDRHVREGLELDALVGGAEFEKRGPAGDPGFSYEYRDAQGTSVAKGQIRYFFLEDRADFDRNGTPVTRDDRYWLRGAHQQELNLGSDVAKVMGAAPVTSDSLASLADHVKLDAEVSKQSDRDLLFEYFRSVAYTQKEQETYVYLRRAWDEVGFRLIGKWRLNDFQSQTEELPSARLDILTFPLFVTDRFGGTYLTVHSEAAHLRTREDDAVPNVPDERLARADVDTRLDYKLPIGNLLYAAAYAEGRYTIWSQSQDHTGALDRVIGATGAHLGSQADAVLPFSIGDYWIRHVLIPEAGFEDRYYVSREPLDLIPVDEVETYKPQEYVFLRLRNRLQYAADADGKRARDFLDLTIEGRYFPKNEPLDPAQKQWATALGDGRLYFGDFGNWRTEVEVDPNRHRLLKLESTVTLLATRAGLAIAGRDPKGIAYPDIALNVGYHDVVDITRAVSWSFDVKLTPSWGFRVEEIYDFLQHSFLRHRVVVTRRFHNWALEGSGSYDPILHDTSFTFSVLPLLEDEDHDPFREGRYADVAGQ
jgi:hypothetical protein